MLCHVSGCLTSLFLRRCGLQKERRLLENRRLDLDSCKARLKKAKLAEAKAAVSESPGVALPLTSLHFHPSLQTPNPHIILLIVHWLALGCFLPWLTYVFILMFTVRGRCEYFWNIVLSPSCLFFPPFSHALAISPLALWNLIIHTAKWKGNEWKGKKNSYCSFSKVIFRSVTQSKSHFCLNVVPS